MVWYFGLRRHAVCQMNSDAYARLTTYKFFPENGDRIILQDVGAHLPVCTVT